MTSCGVWVKRGFCLAPLPLHANIIVFGLPYRAETCSLLSKEGFPYWIRVEMDFGIVTKHPIRFFELADQSWLAIDKSMLWSHIS